jgi:hypothetical protein
VCDSLDHATHDILEIQVLNFVSEPVLCLLQSEAVGSFSLGREPVKRRIVKVLTV